jgi:hypothetical protein
VKSHTIKIIDDLLNSKDFGDIINTLLDIYKKMSIHFKELVKIVCTLILYFIRNHFLNANEVFDAFERYKTSHMGDLREEKNFIDEKLNKICYSKRKNVKPLFRLANIKLKELLKKFSFSQKREILRKFRLPKDFINNILKTEKFNENEFDNIYY